MQTSTTRLFSWHLTEREPKTSGHVPRHSSTLSSPRAHLSLVPFAPDPTLGACSRLDSTTAFSYPFPGARPALRGTAGMGLPAGWCSSSQHVPLILPQRRQTSLDETPSPLPRVPCRGDLLSAVSSVGLQSCSAQGGSRSPERRRGTHRASSASRCKTAFSLHPTHILLEIKMLTLPTTYPNRLHRAAGCFFQISLSQGFLDNYGFTRSACYTSILAETSKPSIGVHELPKPRHYNSVLFVRGHC